MKRFITLLLILLLTISMTACRATDPSEDGNDANTTTIRLSIQYPKQAAKPKPSTPSSEQTDSAAQNNKAEPSAEALAPVDVKMNLSEDATVLQILEAYCQQENIQISVEKNQVSSINKIANTEDFHWQYTINGELEKASPHKKGIKPGDHIFWIFSPVNQK